jgi:hypothetical protein
MGRYKVETLAQHDSMRKNKEAKKHVFKVQSPWYAKKHS